ncbi:MAG: TatD family hydrolase [Clostridiales bacterium]|nr:TatD family hydrolase [Clostridiales bacterium]
MIDTHAHLQDSEFDQDRDDIIRTLKSHGVEAVVCVGTSSQSSQGAIQLASRYDNVYATVGLHPHYCVGKLDLDWIQELVKATKVVALGEFGLDYHYVDYDKDAQIQAFEYQLQLTKQLQLPYVVHMREAAEDTLAILGKYNVPNGIMHCFGGDSNIAKRCLDLGLMISFSGNVTFKKAIDIQDAAKIVPLDRLLIETDSPYLSPVPNRGKRNDSTNLKYVAQYIADLRKISLPQLEQATTLNAASILRIQPLQ